MSQNIFSSITLRANSIPKIIPENENYRIVTRTPPTCRASEDFYMFRFGSCCLLVLVMGVTMERFFFFCILSLDGAFLVAQMVKTLPAMRETWVRSLGPEDPLEKEMAAQSSILGWRFSQRRATVHEVAKSWTHLSD